MTKFLGGMLTVAAAALAVMAQPGAFKVHTRPRLPSTEALERLALKMAWSTRLLLDGERDGLVGVQVLQWTDHPQLVVQSHSGLVALLDAETGDLLWQMQVGKPYTPSFPAGANSDSIFVTRRNVLYVLNRASGLHRLYTTDRFTSVRTNGIELPYMPSASPVADENAIYFVMSTRAIAFRLPGYGAAGEAVKVKTGDLEEPTLPEPGLYYPVGENDIQLAPLVAGNQFTVATAPGTMVSLNRFEQKVRDEYTVDGNVVAMPGQHGLFAYIGTDKGTLYAINMDNSKMAWRFLPGGSIRKHPAVLDRDVFVAADQVGLTRVDRDSGRDLWTARQVDRFLAANDKFVYALHHSGEFQVLDYLRGGALAHYDLKDWTLPVANELTDRIYLGSHDGQLICLRHADLKTPIRYHVPEPKKEVTKEDKQEDKKEDKKEDKQEDKKVNKKEDKQEDKKDNKQKDKKGNKQDDQKNEQASWDGERHGRARAHVTFEAPPARRDAVRLGPDERRR